jgi:hypothetical protein
VSCISDPHRGTTTPRSGYPVKGYPHRGIVPRWGSPIHDTRNINLISDIPIGVLHGPREGISHRGTTPQSEYLFVKVFSRP